MINVCRFANGGLKISIKFFSTEVVFFAVHPAVLKYQAKVVLLVFFYILPTTACWFWKNVSEECGIDGKLAIQDSKCASFVEANQDNATVKSKDSLYFPTSSFPRRGK